MCRRSLVGSVGGRFDTSRLYVGERGESEGGSGELMCPLPSCAERNVVAERQESGQKARGPSHPQTR